MMRSTPATPTLKDAIDHIEAYGTDSQKQDIRKARTAFALHNIEAVDFETFPADLDIFNKRVPKLTGTAPGLQRLIHAASMSENTYKQAWRAARRLIAEYTGATGEKKERRARNDEWAELYQKVGALVDVGLVDRFVARVLPTIMDACRAHRITPTDLDANSVRMLLNVDGAHQRRTLRKGLKALDSLREISRLTDLLPSAPVTPAPKKHGRLATLPPHLRMSIDSWVKHAAREKVEVGYEHLAESLSRSAHYRYSAALSLWVETLLKNGALLTTGTTLADLFAADQVDTVLYQLSSSKKQKARTHYKYTLDLFAILSRHGLAEEAAYIRGLTSVMKHLQKGRAAENSMSPKNQRWCKGLVRDPQKIARFDSQHYTYFGLAQETLATAKAEGFELKDLSDPARMSALSDTERSRAKYLLRRARLFGVLAAYTTIALEAAPFRRRNILEIRHTGPAKTLHLHLEKDHPHAIVKFPNEELKNGKWLTLRNEELEPVTIEKRYDEDYGLQILKFYLSSVRPLFPTADQTHCLFPPRTCANTNSAGLSAATFDLWLAQGSEEIGLPLTSHNLRHGYCSIAINEGRVSIEDLARIIGDTVATLRQHYLWIDRAASVRTVQEDISRRRAEHARDRKGRAR